MLKSFKSVSKWLQTGVSEEGEKREVNFFTCRKVFNALIQKYSQPGADEKTIAHWLGPNASIIHDKNFENAVEKNHSGESYASLSAIEKRSLSLFYVIDHPRLALVNVIQWSMLILLHKLLIAQVSRFS